MARWKLTQPHYLNVKDAEGNGTEWEYKEVNRTTGKPVRKLYEVPRFLHTEDSSDFTHPELGAIIVCLEGKGESRDLTFVGEPTPDMEPLDAEAKSISESLRSKWVAPMGESAMPSQGGYAGARADDFLRELSAMMATQKPSSPVAAPGVTIAEFKALQEQVAALMAKNAELQAQAVPELQARRV